MNYFNRIYLDYNATAPVFPEVMEEMPSFPMGNPSSLHSFGKKSRRRIQEVRDDLYKIFSLKENTFDLFFHSGATEGINSIFKAKALESFQKKEEVLFLYGKGDHSCVVAQVKFFELLGFKTYGINLNSQGQMKGEEIEKICSQVNFSRTKVLLNWTWVNNETGILSPLHELSRLKERYPLFIHVDAVQSVGKISEWSILNPSADAYTFSAHKFGALKGVGFSFIRHQSDFFSLQRGGGQQGGLRGGTENTWGIYSIKKALHLIQEHYDYERQNEAKSFVEERIGELVKDKGIIVGRESKNRNGNTINLIMKGVKAQTMAIALDMGGFEVSNGPACSSGTALPSRVLLAMGFSQELALSGLRFSFSPFFTKEEASDFWPRLEEVLKRFIS